MRFNRTVFAIVVAICLLFQAGPASAQQSNPYWKSESNLPVETITGEWSVAKDGRSAELTITGDNLAAQQTSFIAGWTTPWISIETSFAHLGTLELLLSPTTSASLVERIRFRVKGQGWTQWFKHRLPYEEGLGMGGYGRWAGATSLYHWGAQRVKYQWQLVGELDGLADIDASVQLSVD